MVIGHLSVSSCPMVSDYGRQFVADRRRLVLADARSKPAGQDLGLDVSKVASTSSTGAPAVGHKQTWPNLGLLATL